MSDLFELEDPFRVCYWREFKEDGRKGMSACSPEEASIVEIEMRQRRYTESWRFPANTSTYEIDRLKRMLRWACANGAAQRSGQINEAHRRLGLL